MVCSLWGRKNDLIAPGVPSISTSTGDIQLEDEMEHWATAGAFFRVGYNYKEKYLFEANGRYDGTSKFAEGNRWGFFPSFSAGWNVAREDFWEKWSDKVNTLKIRTSWGQLGNQEIGDYAFYNTYMFGQNYNFGNMLYQNPTAMDD